MAKNQMDEFLSRNTTRFRTFNAPGQKVEKSPQPSATPASAQKPVAEQEKQVQSFSTPAGEQAARKGKSGRPNKDGLTKVRISAYIPEELYKEIQVIQHGMMAPSANTIIKEALETYVQQHKK